MTISTGWGIGLDGFLAEHCPDPKEMRAALEAGGLAGRVDWLPDLKFLCREGERADCYWIVCEGFIRIESGGAFIVLRGTGKVIGEQAFYRAQRDSDGFPMRGAAMRASGEARILRIDCALIDGLAPEHRSLWHETIGRAMCQKLDEATAQRQKLQDHRREYDGLVDRFVCAEGRQAALAALTRDGAIEPQKMRAVVWFSDIKGFSAYSSGLSPVAVSEAIRLVMDVQAEEIAKAGGQIDKFMGDGLMAFWPAPDESRLRWACTKATEAATNAARRLGALFAQHGLPLDIRIGVHAGDVLFGDFGGSGRIAFTCTGQTVNEASRYEQAAAGVTGARLGKVRLSTVVFGLLSDADLRSQFTAEPIEFADKHNTRFSAHTTID